MRILTPVATVGVPPGLTRVKAVGRRRSVPMANGTRADIIMHAFTNPRSETITIPRSTRSPADPNSGLGCRPRHQGLPGHPPERHQMEEGEVEYQVDRHDRHDAEGHRPRDVPTGVLHLPLK